MITLDTSAIVALLNRRAPEHQTLVSSLNADLGPFFVPAQIMAEIAYVVDQRLGEQALTGFLKDIETSVYQLDCGTGDLGRIRELVERYSDMPLGFADAAVVACAERHGGNVLTLDHRHFGVVAGGTAITIYP
ncbi:MAG: PIN domain-containing protein [Thermomicrobiales bacterium]|nr:PIN domain-containing protein [Thermomicrobiales bacterium]